MFYLMSFYLFISNLYLWILSLFYMINKINKIMMWNMMILNSMKIEYIIYIDWMSLMFINTVMLISSMVILYSIEYMNKDYFIKRFMLLILIFVTSMILMILSMNMFSILLGWDGLGLSSYCLVVYYQNKNSFNSSMITILMNRIGDIMILMSIGLMMMFGSLNFLMLNKMNMLIMIFIMITSFTKSAQIPFSTWLPLAMAAPTPISSLVHSSTLVTAGVYLLIRFNNLLNNNLMNFMLIISMLTMIMSSCNAIFEFDFKKIIALSTLSQLSLMIINIMLNLPILGFFHLITHAMFKSLLFLCSGIIIHNYYNFQDIRYLSKIMNKLPFIYSTFNIANLSLCGMPFLSGFYSKDMFIEMFNMNINSTFLFFFIYLSMMLTLMYSFRLLFYMTFTKNKLMFMIFYKSNNLMNYSIMILLILTIFYGSILNWLIFPFLKNIYIIMLPKKLKLMIFFIMIFIITIFMMNLNFKMLFMYNILKFFNLMFFLPMFFKKNKLNIMKLSYLMTYKIDLGWMELIPNKNILMMMKILNNLNMKINLKFFIMMLLMIYMMFLMIFFN